MIIADTTKVGDSKQQLLKTKVCNTLSNKWEENTSKLIKII